MARGSVLVGKVMRGLSPHYEDGKGLAFVGPEGDKDGIISVILLE
jgi:hypothetical protein